MTGTTDESMAAIQRRLERDPAAKGRLLQLKAFELENYHEAVLKVARPVLVEIFELYAAAFAAKGEKPEKLALVALAMTLQDTGLYANFVERVRSRSDGLSEDCLRMMTVRERDVLADPFGIEEAKKS